jgi:pilus assembly protein CpaC
MNTTLQHASRRRDRHQTRLGKPLGKPLAAAAATWLCAGMLIAQPAQATDGDENAPAAKATAAAPSALAHGPVQMTISMTPVPAAPPSAAAMSGPLHGPNCVGSIRGEDTVVVPLGKSVIVPLDEPVRNRTLGNPTVAQATMLSPQTLYLVGESIGTTNMIVQGRGGSCQIIDVVVNVDAGGLMSSLAQLLPGEHGIRVSTAADNLVLSGRVSNSQAAQQAVEIAKVYSAHATGGDGKSGGGVINMLTVDSPQQVMLEVKVAEVDKTLMDQLGAAVNIQGGFGSWSGALVSNLLAGVSSAFGFSKANNKPLAVAVDAQKTDNLVKILAEPNLVTVSGQEATFLAGGEVFIPVPQNSGSGATTIVLQQEEYGVGLKFTPTVLANGKINLHVAPEVSELSSTGVALTATNVTGATILPLITTRRASTTVQIGDGESFAIGGLIKSNVTGALQAVPGLGEIPVLGALLRSTSFQQDRTELVFIITPHLVKPLPTANVPLPTDSFSQPSEVDIYATGNMEGRHAAPANGAAPQNAQPPVPASAPAQVPGSAAAAPGEAATAPHVEPVPSPVSSATPLPQPPQAVPAAPPVPVPAGPNAALDTAPAPEDPAARAARIERDASRIAANEAVAQPEGVAQTASALKP